METKQYWETYLNDHRAGAIAGTELVRRIWRSNRCTEFGPIIETVVELIEQDLVVLDEVRAAAGVLGGDLKRVAALLTERAGRLKLNGHLLTYSPLSRVLELATKADTIDETDPHQDGAVVLRGLVGRRWFLPVVAAVIFLTAWELFGSSVNPILFSPPSRVAGAFVDLVADGRLPRAFLVTLNALSVGFALSVVVGLVVGVLLGRRSTLSRLLEPYIDAVYATPRVVIVPLVIIWFGVGYVGRVFLIWLGTVIPIVLNTAIGVRNARPDLVEVARSMGASERDLIRHVILPASVPYVVAGLRIGAGRALVGVIVAEIFLDLTGLGGIIQTESQYFRTANMLAAVIVVAALGAIIIGSLGGLERRFQAWKAADAE